MNRSGGGLELFWLLISVGSAAAGLFVGLRRAWWFALLGVAVPLGLLVVSRFVTNDSLNGEGDLSWQIVLVVLAVESAVLFFILLSVGAGARAAVELWREKKSPAPRGR
jgi:prepilin signal peptidase PulO-like enzyme (type II secretory pathway)